MRRVLRLADDAEITASQCTDHHEFGPYGLFEGATGGLGRTQFRAGGDGDWQRAGTLFGKACDSKYANLPLKSGTRVELVTPGGGGYGNPANRRRDLIENDLAEGYISEEAAYRLYGYGGARAKQAAE